MRGYWLIFIPLAAVLAATVSYAPAAFSKPDPCRPTRISIAGQVFQLPGITHMRKRGWQQDCEQGSLAKPTDVELAVFSLDLNKRVRGKKTKTFPKVQIRMYTPAKDTYEFSFLNRRQIKWSELQQVNGFYKLENAGARYYLVSTDPEFKTPSGNPVTFKCVSSKISSYGASQKERSACTTTTVDKHGVGIEIGETDSRSIPNGDWRQFRENIMREIEVFRENPEALGAK